MYYGCTVAILCLLFLAAFSWGQIIQIPSNLYVGGGIVSAAAGAASDALSLPDANVPPGYFMAVSISMKVQVLPALQSF